MINYGGIPFELKSNRLNSASLKAIEELENGKGIKAKNSEELFSDLGVDL